MQKKRRPELIVLSIALTLVVVAVIAISALFISLFASANTSARQPMSGGDGLSSSVENTPQTSPTALNSPTSGITPTSPSPASAVVTATPAPRATQTPVSPKSPYVASGNGQQATISAVITWYGYNDNSGETENQRGSAAIAYPKSDGYPTIHSHATEGKGTYTDPITFAAPNKNLKGSFPIGSVIYIPFVKKYFIVEDLCGDDDPEGCQKGTNHADLWMGPAQVLNASSLEQCEEKATPGGTVAVLINPSATLPVDTTQIYTSGNVCTVHLY